MKVALTSDTHGYLPGIPSEADAVLHAGDIGVDRDPITWFREKFYPWARKIAVPIYATFGNHDRIGERGLVPDGAPANLHLIVDELRYVFGVPVWFSPWSLRFFDWAYMDNESGLACRYAKIPETIQVIVAHGPPFRAGDDTGKAFAGSESLAQRIRELPDLRLVVTGHIHEAFGLHECYEVPVWNVSYVDQYYQPTNPPVIIDWPVPKLKDCGVQSKGKTSGFDPENGGSTPPAVAN